jgi:CubicO group peptidase (beta-lactamase class C family)
VVALQLIDQRRLDLDTPTVDVVELTGSAISSAVTVRHLLTHTSGIADDADEEAGEDHEALWAAVLLGDRDPGLAAPIRRQATGVPAGLRVSILEPRGTGRDRIADDGGADVHHHRLPADAC